MRPRPLLRYLLPSVLLPAALVFAASGAMAASIAVTAANDRIVTGDGCSLREAVINANTDSQSGSTECTAGAGADIILLPAAQIALGTAGAPVIDDENAGLTGDIDVTGTLTIEGRGTRLSGVSGQFVTRVFDVRPGAALTLTELAVSSGRVRAADGANIRVAAGAALELVRTRIIYGALLDGAGFGGGGIAVLANAALVVRESEIADNMASGAGVGGGVGGGIACMGCAAVEVISSTVAGNTAEAEQGAGGIHVIGAGSLLLEYATLAHNSGGGINMERNGGVRTGGPVTMNASLLVDNAHLDLVCTAGQAVVADQSLAEHVSGCVVPPSLPVRGAGLPLANQGLVRPIDFLTDPDNAPSRVVVPLAAGTALAVDQIAAAALGCDGRVDQLGSDRPAGGLCDLGALEVPNLVPSVYRLDLQEIDALSGLPGTNSFELRLTNLRAATTTVALAVNPGCAITPASVSIAAGDIASAPITVTAVDDALWDGAPSFTHECVISGTVTAGEPAMLGDGFGALRVVVHDDDSLVPVLVASPLVGGLVDFNVAPVGGFDRQFIDLQNTGRIALNVTAATFLGVDAAQFRVNSVRFPFSLAPGARRTLAIECAPEVAGDYTATLRLATDDPTMPDKDWLVSCRGRYTVQLFASTQLEDEGALAFTVGLSAPNGNGSLYAVVETEDGSAVAGVDYQPLRYRVQFNAGEQFKTVEVPLINDALREADESVILRVVDVSPLAQVMLDGTVAVVGGILDDESRQGDLRVRIERMPAQVAETTPFVADLMLINRGMRAATGISLVSTLRLGALYREAKLNGVPCTVAEDGRTISCSVPGMEARTWQRLRIEARTLPVEDRIGAGGDVDAVVAFAATAVEPEVRTRDNEVSRGFKLLNSSDTGGGGSLPLVGLLLAGLLALRRRGSSAGQ